MSFRFERRCVVCNVIVDTIEFDNQVEMDRHQKLMSTPVFCKEHSNQAYSFWYKLNTQYPTAYLRNDLSILDILKKELKEGKV